MTKQDLEQIRRYMLEKGVKDTELKAANALNGTEIWGAVQEGRSVKISMQDILTFLKPLTEQSDSLFCGFHLDEEDLKGLYPLAKEGSYAWVITSDFPEYPGEVYTFSQMHGWVATGVQASDSTVVDLEDYIKRQEIDEIEGLPEYTSTRAICDGSGNVIEDTYIRRDEVIEGSVKGDSIIPDFNTSAFRITKQNQQIPSILGVTVRAMSATGYVRDIKAMFEAYGVDTDYEHTKIGESSALTGVFSLDADVKQYAYIRVKIYTDLNKSILIYDKIIPVIDDGIDGITPHIGDNGNWFVGNIDTGIVSRGEKGDKGDKGDNGEKGDKGDEGPVGEFNGDSNNILVPVPGVPSGSSLAPLPSVLNFIFNSINTEIDSGLKKVFALKYVEKSRPGVIGYHGKIKLGGAILEFEFGEMRWDKASTGMSSVTFGHKFQIKPYTVLVNGNRTKGGQDGHNYVTNISVTGFEATTDSKECFFLALAGFGSVGDL